MGFDTTTRLCLKFLYDKDMDKKTLRYIAKLDRTIIIQLALKS